ncbi:MAG: phosphatidate cytidylyltransferase [Bdellovibrionales bacterium]|jgi:phosphatidate cytidylyltransferase|nr:phosphatidate cytidylyltransferase [Bdellovibrionales bacterium]
MWQTWKDPVYHETFAIVMGVLIALTVLFFFLRNRNTHAQAGWASLVSWLIATPILFALLAAPWPWALVGLALISITGLKIFFQLTGMFHRSYFVWASYVGSIALCYAIYEGNRELFNLMPMIFFGLICLIPIVRNSHKQMIQYLALTLMAFMFLGWSFLHMGWILKLNHGAYLAIHITILTEVFDNLSLAISRFFGKHKMFSRITPRRNWEAFAIAAPLTIFLAFSLRHLLPERSEPFWVASGLAAVLGGSLGDLVLSVIRRDLGIKDVGVFIIGRGDFLSVLDRLIFVAPIFYYVMWYLETHAAL